MSIRIAALDVADEDAVRAWWEVGRAAVAERRYHAHAAWQATRTYVMGGRPDVIETHLVAHEDGVLVGAARAGSSTIDNLDLAFGQVWVPPEHRRRGIGTALLDALTSWSHENGRGVLTAEVYAPTDQDGPGLSFVRHHGFVVDIEDGMKVADLQATRSTWAALADEMAPAHADYRIITTWAPLPDDLVEGYCQINNAFNELAPSGDLARENERWDADRVRRQERVAAAAGRVDAFAFALAPDGDVVAMTELMLNTTAPHRSFQGGTVVLPAHRGHRLGLAVKLANHRSLLERFPDVEWILTGNADVNVAMNAINDRLGFRVVERCIEVHRPTDRPS